MRKREAIQPRKYIKRKSIPSSRSQTAMYNRKREVVQVPPGSIERGERAKVIPVYLGDLAGSER